MHPIPVFSSHVSPRLEYILDWLFNEQLQTGFRIMTDSTEAEALPFCLAYGTTLSNALSMPDARLLWDQDIRPQELLPGSWWDLPVIFSSAAAGFTLPFDLFSALFYHISRYEEYLPYTPDKHNRYPATDSLQYQSGTLERPLADEWVQAFRQLLQQMFRPVPAPAFVFQPTYDIDIAWSYRHKGVLRAIGGGGKSLLDGNFSGLRERVAVMRGKQPDPYDSFADIQHWHREYDLHPGYFILAAMETSPFDKNISPAHPAMQALVRQLATEGTIGMHPSYYSGTFPERMIAEKEQLESILHRKIRYSRQHYIKMQFPDTCRMLENAGISDDFSMGYGTHPGFRAATGQSFRWYDMPAEKATTLRIHPFCFMDTTARYDCGLNAAQAFQKLEQMAYLLQANHSTLITIFHNFSLGSDKDWAGWGDAYRNFLNQLPLNAESRRHG